jgi:hypothetical protein
VAAPVRPVPQYTERDHLRALFLHSYTLHNSRGRTLLRCRFLANSVPKRVKELLDTGGRDLLRSRLGAQNVEITLVPEGGNTWCHFDIWFRESKFEIRRSRGVFRKAKA